MAICAYNEYNFAAIMILLVFILLFQLSQGPLFWIYSAEVCHDQAFGIVTFGIFLNLFIISIVTEYMIAGMGSHGLFYFYGGMTFLGGLFVHFFVKETRGLNEMQKKQLYKPIKAVQNE